MIPSTHGSTADAPAPPEAAAAKPARAVVAYQFGEFRLDLATHQLLRGGHSIPLTPKAFEMLLALVRHRQRVFGKDELLTAVWPNSFVTEDSLTQNIWALRRALGDDPAQPVYIATIPRTGYRFIAAVVEVDSPAHETVDDGRSHDAARSDNRIHLQTGSGRWGIRDNYLSFAVVIAVTAVVSLGAAAMAQRFLRSPLANVQAVPVVFSQGPPTGTVLLPGVAISPDGRFLAFVAQSVTSRRSSLWLRELASGEIRQLPGTEEAEQPFWSPKSDALGFFAGGQLKTVDLMGTPPQVVATVGVLPQGGSWNQSDAILFAPWVSGLFSVPAAGGAVTPVTEITQASGERSHRRPQFLPDGRHYLFSIQSMRSDDAGTYLGLLGSPARGRIFDGSVAAVQFVPPDRLLGLRGTTLVETRLDIAGGRLTTGITKVAGRIVPPTFEARAGFTASPADVLAFGGGSNSERLMLFSRDGKLLRTLASPSTVNPVLSPGGDQVAATGRDNQAGVWLVDVSRDVSTRIIPDGSLPIWSPDAGSVAFTANRPAGVGDIYIRPVRGHGDEELVLHSPELKVVNDWSRDGRFLVFTSTNQHFKQDLWLLSMTGDRKAIPYLQSGFSQIQAQVSPDGRWLAYASDESGRWEVYLQSFPTPGEKRTVSVGGGGEPKWRADGRELFYVRADKNLMAVEVPSGNPLEGFSEPRVLFTVPVVGDTSTYRSRYTVNTHGDRFLFNAIDDVAQVPITVLVNWLGSSGPH